jgi:hypothetical protein
MLTTSPSTKVKEEWNYTSSPPKHHLCRIAGPLCFFTLLGPSNRHKLFSSEMVYVGNLRMFTVQTLMCGVNCFLFLTVSVMSF